MEKLCFEGKLNKQARSLFSSWKRFIEKQPDLVSAIEDVLPDLDPECLRQAIFHLSLLKRLYVGRDAGWAFVLENKEDIEECSKHLPEDAEVHQTLNVVIVRDPLRKGKESEFEACLRKSGKNFIKIPWVGW